MKAAALFAFFIVTATFGQDAKSSNEDRTPKETSSMTYESLPNKDPRYIQTVRLMVTGTDPKRKFFLVWKESSNAKGYVIERSEGSRDFVKYGEVTAGVTKFEEPKLIAGTFTYRVYPIW